MGNVYTSNYKLALLTLTIGIIAQGCNPASLKIIPGLGQSSLTTEEPTPSPTPEVDPPPPGPQSRQITQNVSPEIANPEVKLFFIVDNSNSMSGYQQVLANGMQSLVPSLEGRNVRFHVFSTTADPNDISSWYDSSLKPASVGVFTHEERERNGQPISNNVPSLIGDTKINYYVSRLADRLNTIGPNWINATSTATEKSERLNSLSQNISSIGTSGSDKESPLCVAYKILNETHPSHKVLNSGDRAAFLMLTNGDESNSLSECYEKYSYPSNYNDTNNPILTESPQPESTGERYRIKKWGVRFYSYPISEGQSSENLQLHYTDIPLNLTTNLAQGNSPCNANTINHLNSTLAGNQRRVLTSNSSYPCYTTTGTITKNLATVQPSVNYCDSVFTETQGGITSTYPNMIQYFVQKNGVTPVANSCSKEYTSPNPIWTNHWQNVSKTPYNFGTPAPANLGVVAKNKADAVLGQNNYFFSSIHIRNNTDSSSCSTAPEGIGNQLNNFITSLGLRGSSHNLCSGNFSSALSSIGQWITANDTSSFTFELEANETITAVQLIIPEQEAQTLSSPLEYTLDGLNIVKVKSSLLMNNNQPIEGAQITITATESN